MIVFALLCQGCVGYCSYNNGALKIRGVGIGVWAYPFASIRAGVFEYDVRTK